MAALTITLFGTLCLQGAGQPITQVPSSRIRDLLAYLLLNRHTAHRREHLAGLFWGDQEEQKARHCLSTSLWRLHRRLDAVHQTPCSYLRVDAQMIGWNTASDIDLDVDAFESRCMLADHLGDDAPEQRARLYHEAVEWYRADLLVDCYEDWCLIERERLRVLYLRALRHLMAYHMERREYEAASESGRDILASDPLREEVHRDLISCYLAMGRSADALRQYRACEELVRRELDEEPMPETQALLPRIIAAGQGQPAPAVAPAPKDELVEQLRTATQCLREAIIAFDASRSHLESITTFIEEIGRRVGMDGVAASASRRVGQESQQAAGPIERVVDLDQILSAPSAADNVSAICIEAKR